MNYINKIGGWTYKILRRSQKYTGTDNVYLAKSGFWLTLGQFFSLVVTFLSAVAFANLLDPTTYGNYKYVLSLLGILAVFCLDGMRTAVTQAVARGFEGSFYTAFITKLKWGLLGSLVAIGGAAYYWVRGNNLLPIPLLISAIFLPLMYASQLYGAFLNGRKLFRIQVNYEIISRIFFTGTIITALFFTRNLFWLIAVYFVSNTFLNYFFYFLTKIKFRPNKKEDQETLNYGKHLSLMSVINYLATYLDKILLFTFVGPAQLAVYSFAVLIPEQIKNMTADINALALPKLSLKSREEIKASMMKKIWKLTLLTGAIIVFYIVIAPYFFKIFFPQYLSSVPYSQILMFTIISFPVSLISTAFHAKLMKKEQYLLRLVAFSRIILLAVLAPLYGIWGVIAARIGAEIVSLSLMLFLFRKF